MLDTPETIDKTIEELNKLMEIDAETEEKYKDMDFSYLDDDDDEEAVEADEETDDSGETDG